jgi:hypothetical protein
MERLLILRLQVRGCSAEARINDIVLGRVAPGQGTLCLPVHEYLFEGDNEVTLVIDPPPAPGNLSANTPKIAEGLIGASLMLLLPRIGQEASSLAARTVGQVDWAAQDGDLYFVPQVVTQTISLPIKFPRWRWLDAPPIENPETHRSLVSRFVQGIFVDLLRGETESFLAASRLRLEEIGLAYQHPVAELTNALRARLHLLYATKSLKLNLTGVPNMIMRPCAMTRLIDCLGTDGQSIMRTEPGKDGGIVSWPLRVAVVNGHCHILR